MLTDAELNAAILESGWVLRDKNALNEFRELARAIELAIRRKINRENSQQIAPVEVGCGCGEACGKNA